MSTDDSDLNDTVDSDEELSDTGKYKIDTAINSDEDEDDEENEDGGKYIGKKYDTDEDNDIEQIEDIPITTTGIQKDIIQNINLKHIEDMFQCQFCEMFYMNDMQSSGDGKPCLHCYFWLNYDLMKSKAPSKFEDAVYAKDEEEIEVITKICDYIKKCHTDHDPSGCMSDNDSCFLCDYAFENFTTDIPEIMIKKKKCDMKMFNYDSNHMRLKIPTQFVV